MINENNTIINDLSQVIRWPKKTKEKEAVIVFLSTMFRLNKRYTEKEVNIIIGSHHLFNDTPLLRRELVSRKLLKRKNDGSVYWRERE